MMSPSSMVPSAPRRVGLRPAFAAPVPSWTVMTRTPDTPSRRTMPSWAGEMPRRGRMTRPCAMSCGTTSFTVSTGTAKPMPALAPEGLAICVFTPMSRPALSRSGPPELPGLIAASVWMTFWIVRPVIALDRAPERAHDARRERLVEAERVSDREDLLAHLQVPARADEDGRELRLRRADPAGRRGPCPARRRRPSPSSPSGPRASRRANREFRITWKFVTTCPCRSHTKPEPAPCGTSVISKRFTARRARLVMKTTEGLQLSKSSIVAFSSEARSPRAATGRASAGAPFRRAGAGATPPAPPIPPRAAA